MKDEKSIINPIIDNNVKMQYKGFFDKSWDKYSSSINDSGYGLKKTNINRGVIYTNDSSRLFEDLSKGYVGFHIKLPNKIENGVYETLLNEELYINEHILWAINPDMLRGSYPSAHGSLTKNGIEFSLWSSYGKCTLIEDDSFFEENEELFFEFIWDSNGFKELKTEDHYIPTMILRINDINLVSSNFPIAPDILKNKSFYFIDTPFGVSDLNAELKLLKFGQNVYNSILNFESPLNFGDVAYGYNSVRNLDLLNIGNLDLTIYGIFLPNYFSTDFNFGNGTIISPGSSISVPINFYSDIEQEIDSIAAIISDNDRGSNELRLLANVVEPILELNVSPENINFVNIVIGESSDGSIFLENNGNVDI